MKKFKSVQPHDRSSQYFLNKRWKSFCAVLMVILLPCIKIAGTVYAEGEKRFTVESHEAMANHWQISRWSDGAPVCDLYVALDKQPTDQEILGNCGYETYQSWVSTPSCQAAAEGGDVRSCEGLFIGYQGKERHMVKELVELPKAEVEVEAVNCNPWGWCGERAVLNFIGKEPLVDHRITSVHVQIGASEKSCSAADCKLRMPITDEKGVLVEYWAASDFGDESEHAFFLLRNVPDESQSDLYKFDVLGSSWDAEAPAGSALWNVFPELNAPDAAVLEQPLSAGYLTSTNRYIYLAGHLIQSGIVDGSSCSGFGLLENRSANPCGEKLAADAMLEWQNQYDAQIYAAAQKYNVPARLLKGIIAQETQFWPYPDASTEMGLGRITENGADMLLTWNTPKYLEVCRSVYSEERCMVGYPSLLPSEQAMLRGWVLSEVGTDQELDLLAATLLASANQTRQLILNTTGQPVADVTTYEEMWRLTVANYHSGSGCMGTAMQATWDHQQDMTLDTIALNLLGDCQGAAGYVESVFSLAK